MPILDLQKRARELGRIRIGQVQPTKSGGTRPAKLDRFRITAHSQDLVQKIAALYGGEATEWQPQGGGPAGWEVVTDSTRLPILVPPQPISQYLEHWSRGGCARRCDGNRELLSDKPCLCGPDPAQRMCKPTTRLNVILREVEGIGVFRLETHGWYAATELPMAAELLATAGSYITGFLGLEERIVKRDGETLRFMVPTIDIAMTPGELMAGGGAAGQLGAGPQPAVDAPQQRTALPAGAEAPPAKSVMNDAELDMLLEQIRGVASLDALSGLSRQIVERYEVDPAGPVPQAFRARAAELQKPADPPKEMQVDSAGPSAGDPGVAWNEIMQAVPEEWSTTQVEQDFEAFAGVSAEQGTAKQMREYLVALPERLKASA